MQAIRYNATQEGMIQYNQWGTIQYNSYDVVQYDAMRCDMVMYDEFDNIWDMLLYIILCYYYIVISLLSSR